MPASVVKTSGAVSVATTDTQIVAGNRSRRVLIIVNDSANIVYLAFATADATAFAAVANSGFRLSVGGVLEIDGTYSGPVRGIAMTGASTVTVFEI